MLLRSIKGLFTLIRIVPVLSWSFCAILLSVGFAIHDRHGLGSLPWIAICLLLLGALTLQGIVAHALNDRTDWRSGTDQKSPGILSGGSKVIRKGFYSETQLLVVGILGILLAIGLGVYLQSLTAHSVWIFILVGIWSAWSYSSYPFRLSYYPFLGEWLAAFPAMAACTLGTYYILTGSVSVPVIWAAIIHSLLCVGWLMQHHTSDIDADWEAVPQKITTVAWIASRVGKSAVPNLTASYFLLATFVSILATLAVHKIFILSVLCSLLGASSARQTNPFNIANITFNQVKMILLTLIHALLLFGFEIVTR
ncbi:prenyltransferase [Effusibacillus dendaii]|uniref:1,4-dihydroxy-2-naphthoate octaprenyltransferase n=1 Tax=Effusibacillus dendaii TaxID=2743772 RepID=A0A7I8DBK9_9BACL|nr:prenyltransferase [Effusibacillus dendaii]BCJ87464.1 hypothetical protein skT53_24490 [Effusibacillus dendaii]